MEIRATNSFLLLRQKLFTLRWATIGSHLLNYQICTSYTLALLNEKWDVNRKLRTKWLGLGVRLFHSQFTHVLGGLTMASLPANQDLLFENLFTKLEDDKGGKVFQEITKECFWTLKCFCTYRLKCYEQICGWLQCKMLVGLKVKLWKTSTQFCDAIPVHIPGH